MLPMRGSLWGKGSSTMGENVIGRNNNVVLDFFEEVGKGKNEESTSETDEAIGSTREEGREEGELMELQIATKKAAVGHKLGIGIVAKQAGGRIRAKWKLVERRAHRDTQDEAVAVRLALMKAGQ